MPEPATAPAPSYSQTPIGGMAAPTRITAEQKRAWAEKVSMDMLGRAPSQEAVDYIVRDLSITSQAQVVQVYRNMLTSKNGSKSRSEVVQRAFENALGRSPTSTEAAKWTQRIADTGQGYGEIVGQVAHEELARTPVSTPTPVSPPAIQPPATTTKATSARITPDQKRSWTEQVSMDMLGRAPSQEAIDYIVRDLSITSQSQVVQVYRDMLTSKNGGKNRSEVVQRAFENALGRSPTATEAAKWTQRIADTGQGYGEIVGQVGREEPARAPVATPTPVVSPPATQPPASQPPATTTKATPARITPDQKRAWTEQVSMDMLGRTPTKEAIDYIVRDLSITSQSQVTDIYRSMLTGTSDTYRSEVVKRLYQQEAGRDPTKNELAKWSQRITETGKGYATISTEMAAAGAFNPQTASNESASKTGGQSPAASLPTTKVKREWAYDAAVAMLGSSPSQTDLNRIIDEPSIRSAADAVAYFKAQLADPNQTATRNAMVERAFGAAVQRKPTDAERLKWTQRVAAGGQGYNEVVPQITQEEKPNPPVLSLAERTTICKEEFQKRVQRAPKSDELTLMLQRSGLATNRDQVREAVQGLTGNFTGISLAYEIIERAYARLGRPVGSGLQQWVNEVCKYSWGVDEVVQQILTQQPSAETKQSWVRELYPYYYGLAPTTEELQKMAANPNIQTKEQMQSAYRHEVQQRARMLEHINAAVLLVNRAAREVYGRDVFGEEEKAHYLGKPYAEVVAEMRAKLASQNARNTKVEPPVVNPPPPAPKAAEAETLEGIFHIVDDLATLEGKTCAEVGEADKGYVSLQGDNYTWVKSDGTVTARGTPVTNPPGITIRAGETVLLVSDGYFPVYLVRQQNYQATGPGGAAALTAYMAEIGWQQQMRKVSSLPGGGNGRLSPTASNPRTTTVPWGERDLRRLVGEWAMGITGQLVSLGRLVMAEGGRYEWFDSAGKPQGSGQLQYETDSSGQTYWFTERDGKRYRLTLDKLGEFITLYSASQAFGRKIYAATGKRTKGDCRFWNR